MHNMTEILLKVALNTINQPTKMHNRHMKISFPCMGIENKMKEYQGYYSIPSHNKYG